MRIRLLALITLSLAFQGQAQAQYQSLTLKKQKVESQSFKLNVKESTASFKPSNVGIIGMKYLHKPGSMSTVVEVFPHTPAQEAGIQIGDRLIAIDGTNIIPYDANQIFAMIAGLPGTPINLQFMRCNNFGSGCRTLKKDLIRMDMNKLNSDRVFQIYKYGD